MATYVMSDLHGQYEAYIKMLGKIKFSAYDELYILGDILDRGPNPIKIMLDVMDRSNVKVLAGNHCIMAYECLRFLIKEITYVGISRMESEMMGKLIDWQLNGARTTTDEFHKCDKETRGRIVDFIVDLDLLDEIEVAGKTFVLVHAGLGNFLPDKQLYEYELEELVWMRTDYETPYFENKYVVTGHTPTMIIEGNPRPGYIYHANNHIAIDCGCSFSGGRLGCLRLDDLKEFYVDIKDV